MTIQDDEKNELPEALMPSWKAYKSMASLYGVYPLKAAGLELALKEATFRLEVYRLKVRRAVELLEGDLFVSPKDEKKALQILLEILEDGKSKGAKNESTAADK